MAAFLSGSAFTRQVAGRTAPALGARSRAMATRVTAMRMRSLSSSAAAPEKAKGSASAAAEGPSPHLIPLYARPADLVIARGRGSLLYDEKGREFVDFTAGIAVCALGHADKGVAMVLAEQAHKLVHISNLYRTRESERLARLLADSAGRAYLAAPPFGDKALAAAVPETPDRELNQVFFCNSGTEANEAAIKFARARYQGQNKHRILTFHDAFHGRSMGALSATPNQKYRAPFEPLVPGFETVDYNDLTAAEAKLAEGGFCGILVEPLQGEGGVRPAAEGFLEGLRQLADSHDCLLMFDEIQCGLARTGRVWAHHWTAVTPDVLTAAKPLGNGVPIGAVLASKHATSKLGPGAHGTTFGGNPLACAVGAHVLLRLTDPTLLAHVSVMSSDVVAPTLAEWQAKWSDKITAVRGRGLIWGVELATREHNGVPVAKFVVDTCRERGLLLCTAGKAGNVLRIVPPLNSPRDVLKRGLDILASTIADIN